MKKTILIVLLLTILLGCVGCSKGSSFTVDQLKAALGWNFFEIENFEIIEQDKGYSFNAHNNDYTLTGTADKKQRVTYVKFENFNVDKDAYDSTSSYFYWAQRYLGSNGSGLTVGEIFQITPTENCRHEISALYDLTHEDGSAMEFALKALSERETSEIQNWDIKITDPDSTTLVIEATYIG